MESLISDPCSYSRGQILPPFLLNGEDPTSLLIRERATYLGIHSSSSPAPPMHGSRAPVMWRSHPAFPTLNPNDVYSFLASCPPWYSAAALGAHFRAPNPSSSSLSPSSTAALAFAGSPHFWSASNGQLSSELLRSASLLPTTAGTGSNGGGPIRSIHPTDPSLHRYAPYLYSSPKKELTNTSNVQLTSSSNTSTTNGLSNYSNSNNNISTNITNSNSNLRLTEINR